MVFTLNYYLVIFISLELQDRNIFKYWYLHIYDEQVNLHESLLCVIIMFLHMHLLYCIYTLPYTFEE